jgi:hypothetical protein
MAEFQSSFEEYRFSNTDSLVNFLKEEWFYEQKEIDNLLNEQQDERCYSDAHEQTTVELVLFPVFYTDNSSGGKQWYLSVKTTSNLHDNYA